MPESLHVHLHAQHLGLTRLLPSLAQLLSSVAAAPEQEWPEQQERDAVTLLCNLERELGRHFALEEQEAPLEAAVRAAPHLDARAHGLPEEHGSLLARLTHVAALAREAGHSHRTWQQIEHEFRSFARALVDHERAENEIIWRAWSQDEGGGD